MASTSKISEKERAIIEGLMKAENGPEDVKFFSEAAGGKVQVITRANMMNNGVAAMHFHDKHIWSGKPDGTYPKTIALNHSGSITQRGIPPRDSEGSMGAVVYIGPKYQGGTNECAWVLAWSALGNGSQNKVYVETGPASKYPKGSIDWEDIKKNLLDSESYSPPNHGAEASAMIEPSGNSPSLGATFNVNLDE